ncbi:MAG TPA: ABC transporter substrate-binding protein [Stellaceae bacterium]|jgi:NitT/TauT family transport system substrate-binding protein
MRRCLTALLLVGLLLATRGAGAADRLRVGKAVQVGWTFTICEVAADQGIFAKYGIDAEIIPFAGEAKLMQGFAAGAVDVGVGSGPGMVFNVKGSPTVAVAAYASDPRNIAVIVLPDSPIHSVADLKGKSLSVSSPGSLTEWLVKRIATQEGWGPDGVKPVAVNSGAPQVAALKTHQVDGMMSSTEQGFAFEETDQGRIIVTMNRYAPVFIAHVIEAQKSLVDQNADLVDRFLKAYFATIAFIKTHKDIDVAIASKVLGSSLEVESRTYDAQVSMLLDDGQFDPAAIEVIKDSFIEMGQLTKRPDTDQLLTTRFLPVKP